MKNKADILLGLQWGDEGKGKIVDVLTSSYDVVVRFQGGPNAGHTININGYKQVLHTIPSGIFRDKCINIIGNGVVIDPVILLKEIELIKKANINISKKLFISKKAHIIMPTHLILDEAAEYLKGKNKIGSTLKGIGPAYMDKTGRNGIRIGDIFSPCFFNKYNNLVNKHIEFLKLYDYNYKLKEKKWLDAIEKIKKLNIVDSEYLINKLLKEKKLILLEGAQGSLLDIDFGSYPYVTSSNTIAAGACIGTGLPPTAIGEIYGIFKAYCTRVGSGPFPTELFDDTATFLRKKGNEFGATTGRPRRCGWLDIPALKYSIMINGVSKLIMTKADVLSGLKKIKVCTHYSFNGKEKNDKMPYDIVNNKVYPVYKEFDGWNIDVSTLNNINDFPKELRIFIDFLEDTLEIPITLVSFGPERKQIVENNKVVY